MTKEDIMTSEQVCEILSIKLPTLYDWRYRERTGIPIYKIGKYLFTNKCEFDKWYRSKAVSEVN
jgi:predicted site-specific integrase-resolvase